MAELGPSGCGFTPVTRHHEAVRIGKRFVKLVLETRAQRERLRARSGPRHDFPAAQAEGALGFVGHCVASAVQPRCSPRAGYRARFAAAAGRLRQLALRRAGAMRPSPRRALTRASVTSATVRGNVETNRSPSASQPLGGIVPVSVVQLEPRSNARRYTCARSCPTFLARTSPSSIWRRRGKRLAERKRHHQYKGQNRPPHRHDRP